MHFVVSPFGSAGDVYPYLGVALELQKRGHEITFVVNEHFKEVVQRFGLKYQKLGTQEEFLACASNPDLWSPLRGFHHVFHSLIEPSLRKQYDICVERYEPRRTVAITNCFGFGALLAQEKIGLPVVTVHLQPSVIWSDIEPPLVAGLFGPRWFRSLNYKLGERFFIDPGVCPFLNAWRHELDLAPMRRTTRWWNSPSCVACLFPDWFCSPQADWPNNLIQTDFPLWDEPTEDGLPDNVAAFLADNEPPLVFTPGSANMFGEAFFKSAVEACRLLKRRGILLSRFPHQILANLPDSVVHFAYVPFSQLLTKAAAVVHHGGVGSTSQGFAAGIPQLLMPLAHDQFDNAARVKRLGVGDWLKMANVTGPRMARKLDGLLGSRKVAESCREVAKRLAKKDGCERTAVALEQWADRPQRALT